MADKKLKIVWPEGSFDIKLENLSGKAEPRKVNGKPICMKTDGSPEIVRKAPNGKMVEFARRAPDGSILTETMNCYVDDTGTAYAPNEVLNYYKTEDGDLIEATKNEKTEVFEVSKFEPLENYLDKYQMDTYHQVKPGTGESKKDFAKKLAIQANTVGMKKLWDKLNSENLVGRGTLNLTSNGWLPSVGYIRAIKVNGSKWTLELAVFKQPKMFTWVEELEFKPTQIQQPQTKATAQVEEI
jgi:hypothetical protein